MIQETRKWDDNKEYSYAMRSKEDAQDYRYFPDPDLPPVRISDEWLTRVRRALPELQPEKQIRYEREYGLPRYDAQILTGSRKLADIFESASAICDKPKKVSNWLMGETLRLLKVHDQEPDDLTFSPENLAKLVQLSDEGTVSSTVAKDVFEKVFLEDVDPACYVEEHGLKTVNDMDLLTEVVKKVISQNPAPVEEYKAGKEKVLGFLVGRVMKAMKGKANPSAAKELIKKLI